MTAIICYAREDVDRVRLIADGLKVHGLPVWLDFPTLSPSLLFSAEAQAVLKEASRVVLVWSKTSVAFQWGKDELQSLLGSHRIVPVVIDENIHAPYPIEPMDQQDLSSWNGDPQAPEFREFVSVCSNMLKTLEGELETEDDAEWEQASVGAAPDPQPGINPSIDPPLMAEPRDSFGQSAVLPLGLRRAIAFRETSPPDNEKPLVARKNSNLTTVPSEVKAPGGLVSTRPARRSRTASTRRSYDKSDAVTYSSRPRASLPGRLFKFALIGGGLALAGWLGYKFLPLLLGMTSTVKNRDEEESSNKNQPVDCSVFAPPKVAVGDEILVQIYLHPPALKAEAEAGAKEFDSEAAWRGFTSLRLDLAPGTQVGVQLEVGDLSVDEEGVGQIRWNNRVIGISFWVSAPEGTKLGKHRGTVRLLVDGVPAGTIKFIIGVEASLEEEAPAEALGDLSHRYNKAFISYASQDRVEVLKRVQTLGALKIDYFQDVLDLDPGDRWERELYKEIDSCDLFLLFWSSASKGSEWVHKEAAYALERQKRNQDDQPDIIPLLIEGPPPPKPWPEFNSRHFNDRLLYVMKYSGEG